MDWLRFAGVAMMSVSSACTITTPCDGDVLYVHPVPGDTTVAIGQQFTARISVSTCGKRAVDDTFTWSSEDTTVLRVERETETASPAIHSDNAGRVVYCSRLGFLYWWSDSAASGDRFSEERKRVECPCDSVLVCRLSENRPIGRQKPA